jgi:sphingolipid 4-desaturase/C4-monooxygenase
MANPATAPAPDSVAMPDAVTWHLRRHRVILREHAEVRELFGTDATSGLWGVGLVIGQVALALVAARVPTWAMLALSASVGAVIAHALGVLIHEACHNLIYKGSPKNKALAILANAPLGAPAAIAFRYQHLLHHRYLGDTDCPGGRDTQAPTRTEIDFVGKGTVRKLLSFTFGRFFYKARPANTPPRDVWLLANLVVCVLADVGLVAAGGPRALIYVVVSSLVAFGPHALGGRRVAEHLTIRRGQPTNSCYGLLNRVSFDVGYHVEHHDFPAIPWRRMRRLHALAHEHYDDLARVASWGSLMAAYFFDRRFGVGQYTGASADFLEEASAPEATPEPAPRRLVFARALVLAAKEE